MKYKIVVPVVAQVNDFRNLLKQIPDKSRLTIVNNFDDPAVRRLCNASKKLGASIVNWPENRGCAASWNVGLKMIDDDNLDFVIICSPSCIWNKDVAEFAKEIEKLEKVEPGLMYIATGQHHTDTHAFAITKLGLDTIGYFDENFHPVYMEDADYYRRMALLGVNRTLVEGLRKSSALNGGVKKNPRIWNQYINSAEAIKAYYIKKWGKPPGREYFEVPYNREVYTLKDWKPVDREKLVNLLSEEEYNAKVAAGVICEY